MTAAEVFHELVDGRFGDQPGWTVAVRSGAVVARRAFESSCNAVVSDVAATDSDDLGHLTDFEVSFWHGVVPSAGSGVRGVSPLVTP